MQVVSGPSITMPVVSVQVAEAGGMESGLHPLLKARAQASYHLPYLDQRAAKTTARAGHVPWMIAFKLRL
jgi:hypothetical protein